MKKQVYVTIASPCSENWEKFQAVENARFCSECSQNVVDLTHLVDQELARFLASTKGDLCGRLRKDQLRSRHQPSRLGFGWMHTAVLGTLLAITATVSNGQTVPPASGTTRVEANTSTSTQEFVVKGAVVDETKEPLIGANVVLKGSRIGTATDKDGRFEFPIKLKEGDILYFSFVGMKSQEYVVSATDSPTIELSMELSYEVLLGKLSVDEVYSEEIPWTGRLWRRVTSIF